MRIQQVTLDESCCGKANTKATKEKAKVTESQAKARFFVTLVFAFIFCSEGNIFVLDLCNVSGIFLLTVALVEGCASSAGRRRGSA